jgi:hypothetical protein
MLLHFAISERHGIFLKTASALIAKAILKDGFYLDKSRSFFCGGVWKQIGVFDAGKFITGKTDWIGGSFFYNLGDTRTTRSNPATTD